MEGSLFFKYKGTLSRFKAWKQYYVSLTYDKLSCYPTRFSLEASVSILCRDIIRVERKKEKKMQNRFRVWVSNNNHVYYFKAKRKTGAEKWCTMVVKVWKEIMAQPTEREDIRCIPAFHQNGMTTESPLSSLFSDMDISLNPGFSSQNSDMETNKYPKGSAEYEYAKLHNSLTSLQKLFVYFITLDISVNTPESTGSDSPNVKPVSAKSQYEIEKDIIMMQLFPDDLTILNLLLGFEENYVKQFLPYQPYEKPSNKNLLATPKNQHTFAPGKTHIPLRPLAELECKAQLLTEPAYLDVVRSSYSTRQSRASVSQRTSQFVMSRSSLNSASRNSIKSLKLSHKKSNKKSKSKFIKKTCDTIFKCNEPVYSPLGGKHCSYCERHNKMELEVHDLLTTLGTRWLAREFPKPLYQLLLLVLINMLGNYSDDNKEKVTEISIPLGKKEKEISNNLVENKEQLKSGVTKKELEQHGLVVKTLWSMLMFQDLKDFEEIGFFSIPEEEQETTATHRKMESFEIIKSPAKGHSRQLTWGGSAAFIEEDESDEEFDHETWEDGDNLLEKNDSQNDKKEATDHKKIESVLSFAGYLVINTNGEDYIAKTIETFFDILLHKEEGKKERPWSLTHPSPGRGINVIFGQTVVNPDIWSALFLMIQKGSFQLQAETFKAVNALVINNKHNCETLLAQEGWQSLLFLSIDSTRKGGDENAFLRKTISNYFLNIFALIHSHAYSYHDDFLEIICESLMSLYACTSDTEIADDLARTILGSLVSLLKHKKYQFNNNDSTLKIWKHLPLLTKLISKFVFQKHNFIRSIKGSGLNRVMVSKLIDRKNSTYFRQSLISDKLIPDKFSKTHSRNVSSTFQELKRDAKDNDSIGSQVKSVSSVDLEKDSPNISPTTLKQFTFPRIKKDKNKLAVETMETTEMQDNVEFWKEKFSQKEKECHEKDTEIVKLQSEVKRLKAIIAGLRNGNSSGLTDVAKDNCTTVEEKIDIKLPLSTRSSLSRPQLMLVSSHEFLSSRSMSLSHGFQFQSFEAEKPCTDPLGSQMFSLEELSKKKQNNNDFQKISYGIHWKELEDGYQCLDVPLLKKLLYLYETLSLGWDKSRDFRRNVNDKDRAFFDDQGEYFDFISDCCALLEHIQKIPKLKLPPTLALSSIIGNFLNSESKENRRIVFSREHQLTPGRDNPRIPRRTMTPASPRNKRSLKHWRGSPQRRT